jgi:two-component sensor histidine kinase
VAAATAPGTFTGPSLDGFEQIAGFVPPSIGPGGLYVGSGQSRDRAFAALNAATLRGIVLIGIGVLAALLLAHFTGERLIRQPVRQLLATAARWRAGDLSARSRLSGVTEFGQLGLAFDGMAADLERAFADKDLLLRELSHRVTNSLTAISSMLRMQSMRCDT